MKKWMVVAIILGVFVGGTAFFVRACISLKESNEVLYSNFGEYGVLDVDGEVNLSALEMEHDNLENELLQLFGESEIVEDVYLNKIAEKKELNGNLEVEIASLLEEATRLEGQKQELSNQYDTLNNKYVNLKKALALNKVSVSSSENGFPLINQYPNYPTGCESVALTMLLRYHGVGVSPSEVINNLRKESLPYYESGIRYGGNPEVGFVGNPYSNASYGVYEKPIAEVANFYKSGVQVRENFSFDEVLSLVQSNRPVMVWTSMGLSVPYISESCVYRPTMETIYWKAGEHAVVVVSYSGGDTVIVADPIGGKLKSYSKSLFEERYNYFGRKALFY